MLVMEGEIPLYLKRRSPVVDCVKELSPEEPSNDRKGRGRAVQGLMWGVLGWFGLESVRSRRLWVASGLVATVALTAIGVLSTVGIIGRFIVG
jgi:hypothetical protein